MRRPWLVSAVVGVQGNGEGWGGVNRISGRKPDQENVESGGDRTSRRKPAVDESGKEMADRVARH